MVGLFKELNATALTRHYASHMRDEKRQLALDIFHSAQPEIASRGSVGHGTDADQTPAGLKYLYTVEDERTCKVQNFLKLRVAAKDDLYGKVKELILTDTVKYILKILSFV
jgi:hypothetical protein